VTETHWDSRAIRELQEQLHAVKFCGECGRTLPIAAFWLPGLNQRNGHPCKECCMKWPSRQRHAA
jgi:hypothetical protein